MLSGSDQTLANLNQNINFQTHETKYLLFFK